MLTIRLQRIGSRNNPDFRIVLAEKHRSASKKVLEVFGEYDPRTKNLALKDQQQLLEWVNRNIELSPTVRNLLISHKLIEGAKVKAWRPKVKEKPAQIAVPEVPAASGEEKKAEEPAGSEAEAKGGDEQKGT